VEDHTSAEDHGDLCQRAFRRSPVALAVFEDFPVCLATSDRLLELLGRRREDVEQVDVLGLVHPDDIPVVTDSVAEASASSHVVEIQVRMSHADGRWLPLRVGCRHDNGVIIASFALTEGDADQLIRRRLEFESLLERIGSRFIDVAAADIDDALRWALERVGRYLGADRAYVIDLDHDREVMNMTHEWCRPGTSTLTGKYVDLPFGVFPEAVGRLSRGEASLHHDTGHLDPKWWDDAEEYAAEGVRSAAEFPFLVDGVAAGVVGFDWVDSEATWTYEDVPQMRSFASAVGQVLLRQRAQAELATHAARLQHLFSDAPVALTLVRPDGTLVEANRAFLELVDRDDVAGLNSFELVAPEDRDAALAWAVGNRAAEFEDPTPLESRLLSRSGERIWTRTQVSAVRVEGELRYLIGHVTDISAHKATEAALSSSEVRFQALADALPDPVIRFGLDARPLAYNRVAAELFSDEGEVVPPDEELDRTLTRLGAEAVRTRSVQLFEHEVTVRGHPRFYRTRLVPELDAEGQPTAVIVISTDITDRRDVELELAHRATTDPLTGLCNRAAFLDALAGVIAGLDAAERAAVLFCDLDRFKVVNDSLGHGRGDELLSAVADRLRAELPVATTLARLGGDEFTVLLGATDEGSARAIAERIRSVLAAPFEIDGKVLGVGVSVGVTMVEPHDEPDEVMRRADAAMYRAKDDGRARVAFFDADLEARIAHRVDLDQRLRWALERNELRVFYQPEVDLGTGEILGAEALVRWERDGQLLPAGEFIEVAEDSGLIVPIGNWVLQRAVSDAVRWAERAPWARFSARVNLSARQFDQPDLADLIRACLHEAGLPPDRLCLELTETALMADPEAAQETLEVLHHLGVSVAIDDFGTGYSSLAYLKRFPVDVVKIDRSFVWGLPHDPDDAAIVSSIIGLAQALQLTVTAEGIETAEQVNALRRLGCGRGQGFLFARPGPPEVFAQLLERRLPCPR
jgi:diguanylate cyclase (GGDEF)-like protein/PAS domain S-box-containing protein